jgi:hypothetical protein
VTPFLLSRGVVLAGLLAAGLPAAAQTIKLNRGLAGVIDTTQLTLQRKRDIFTDYDWLRPDVKSQPLALAGGAATATYAGQTLAFQLAGDSLVLTAGGRRQAAHLETRTDCYPNLARLKLRPVTVSMMVPQYSMSMVTVPVIQYRSVTTYSYNASTHTSQSHTSSQSYTTYQSRYTPRTTYTYRPSTTYKLDVPEAKVYAFRDVLAPGDEFLVYRATEGGQTAYYVQSVSYLQATTAGGINYLLLDQDGNGSFFDAQDQVAFNTWNPYKKSAVFRSLRYFKGNRWYSHAYLKDQHFISLVPDAALATLHSQDLNRAYYAGRQHGELTFANLPEDCTLEIGGESYPYRKFKKGIDCRYGHYNLLVKRPGYLDYRQTVEVSAATPKPLVQYPSAQATGKPVKLSNIFSNNYFVTVSDDQGYEATYFNTRDFVAPARAVKTEVDNEGHTYEQTADLAQVETLAIDYEKALKAQLPTDGKDAAPTKASAEEPSQTPAEDHQATKKPRRKANTTAPEKP